MLARNIQLYTEVIAGTYRGLNRVLDLLGLELQLPDVCPMKVTELS